MNTTSQTTQIPITQVSDTLETTVTQLDQTRAADLDEMTQVRAAKFNVLARDRKRLAAKLGADNPRVAALDRSIQLHADTAVGFQSEIAASSTPPPQVTSTSWTLHGNVFDTGSKPIPRVTIALYQQDTWQRGLGYACTDKNGYFVLKVDGASKTQSEPLSLRVLLSRKIIYTDPSPVTIHAGHVEHRELVIGDTSGTCEPPSTTTGAPPPCPPDKQEPAASPGHKPPDPEHKTEPAEKVPRKGARKK